MDITLDSGNTKVILTVEGEERVNGVRRAISLPYDASGVKLEIDGNRISNLFGEEGIDKSNIIINDKIAPEMYNITVGTGNKEIFITFTEKLDPYSKNLFALDFIITDEDDDELRAGVDYTTDLLSDGKTIKVTVINGDYGEYIVKSEDTLKYIEDLEGNMAVKFDDKKVTLTDKVVPTVIQSIINDIAVSKTAAVEFSKPLNASSRTSVENKIQAANSVGGTLGFSWNTEGSKLIVTNNTGKVTNFRGDKQSIEVKVTVMDLVGNGSEVTIINLGDETAPTLISEPIKGEIEASKFASIKFSEPLFKESREQLENIIRNATTKAKDTLVFTWSDNNSTLTITNNGLESTNFKGTGESARVEVKVKDLTNHESALLTIINISDTTAPSIISGTITDEIKAKEFVSIVFSEKLAGDSKTAIENAIKATKKADNATLGFTWSDGELMLTVTNSGTEATNFKGEAESAKFDVVVKDLAQNESTLTIINISDTTTPKLVSAPIIGEIVAGNTVELVFSEKLKADGEYNSKTAVENAIKGATTAAKTSLTFTWTDVVNKVTIKNTSTTESTNFANTLVLAQRKALAAIKDLSSNSATVTVINIPETTITGSISEELPQGETELTISFMQGEVAANISDIELDKVITAVIKAAGEGANDFTAIRDFQTIAGTEQNKYLGVKMKGNNLTTTTTTFAKAVSPIFIPLDSESISTAKRIFVLTINIPVNNP